MAQASGATGQAQEKAKEVAGQVAGQAQEKVGQVKGQARSQVYTQVDDKSTMAGQQIKTVADAIRGSTDQLRQNGQDKPAQVVEQLAGKAEQAGSWLERSDADQILNDVENFARKQPWAVAVGGVLAGFAAARFLKASSEKRFESYQGTYSSRPYNPAPAGTYGNGGTYGNPQDISGELPATGQTYPSTPSLGTTRPIPPSEPGLGSTGGL
jgi:hypothetical protein